MPLFALRQNNKDRLIADGRRGKHNGCTYEQESLLPPNVDVVASAVEETAVRFMRHEARSQVLWGLVHRHKARVDPSYQGGEGVAGTPGVLTPRCSATRKRCMPVLSYRQRHARYTRTRTNTTTTTTTTTRLRQVDTHC